MGNKVTLIGKDGIFDYFDVKEKLGSGNFAVVKRALRLSDGKEVALKIIKKNTLKPHELETIHDEVTVMQKIDHPNCVKLFEIYESSEKLFLVLEFLAGGELFDRIIAKEKFTEHEAAGVVKQIAEGLEHLHSVGVVHRDLKPENLLYETKDEDSSIKITDFGLAKYRTENLDLMSSCCGTPGYVAPEVLKHQLYDEKCDTWSLGVILYILLCGFPPFHSENTAELYRQIKKGEYSFPDPYWTNVSNIAKDLVRKLLNVNPAERLSATQVLAHPWVKRETADAPKDFHASFNTNLKQLVARRRLRRGVQLVLALNRLSSIFVGKLEEKQKTRRSSLPAVKIAEDTKKLANGHTPATAHGTTAHGTTAHAAAANGVKRQPSYLLRNSGVGGGGGQPAMMAQRSRSRGALDREWSNVTNNPVPLKQRSKSTVGMKSVSGATTPVNHRKAGKS